MTHVALADLQERYVSSFVHSRRHFLDIGLALVLIFAMAIQIPIFTFAGAVMYLYPNVALGFLAAILIVWLHRIDAL